MSFTNITSLTTYYKPTIIIFVSIIIIVVKRYRKGANAERDLAKKLKALGFSVIRAARSGGSISTPDLVAIKNKNILAFECKAWKIKPILKKVELKELKKWCKKSGAIGILGWKKRGSWLFLKVDQIKDKSIVRDGINIKQLVKEIK